MQHTSPSLVKDIFQNNRSTFTIIWTDGKSQRFDLSRLQAHCPCASCLKSREKDVTLFEKTLDPNIGARRVYSVGRYALRVEFTSGCLMGIYDFDLLRQLGETYV